MPRGVYMVDVFQAPQSMLTMSADEQSLRIDWISKIARFPKGGSNQR